MASAGNRARVRARRPAVSAYMLLRGKFPARWHLLWVRAVSRGERERKREGRGRELLAAAAALHLRLLLVCSSPAAARISHEAAPASPPGCASPLAVHTCSPVSVDQPDLHSSAVCSCSPASVDRLPSAWAWTLPASSLLRVAVAIRRSIRTSPVRPLRVAVRRSIRTALVRLPYVCASAWYVPYLLSVSGLPKANSQACTLVVLSALRAMLLLCI